MDCEATRRLVEANVDGELDLVRHLEIETHLAGCSECAGLAAGLRARHEVLREKLVRHRAPAHLAARIADSLADARPPVTTSELRPPRSRPLVLQAFAVAALIMIAVTLGYQWGASRSRSGSLIAEAMAQHVRSLQADHLTDVASTDEHTVKPWFAGKLDFSPPVFDLAAAGFPLIGGRLDRLDDHPAAALVFRRRQHAINLFVWLQSDRPVAAAQEQRDGFTAMAWTAQGLCFLAVSEIAAPELTVFAETFRARAR
jgi:anti-sigma factor RsiW